MGGRAGPLGGPQPLVRAEVGPRRAKKGFFEACVTPRDDGGPGKDGEGLSAGRGGTGALPARGETRGTVPRPRNTRDRRARPPRTDGQTDDGNLAKKNAKIQSRTRGRPARPHRTQERPEKPSQTKDISILKF